MDLDFTTYLHTKPEPKKARKVQTPRNTIKKPVQKEKDEGKALVQYLEWLGVRFTHIANETSRHDWSMYHQGVRAGVPDYMIILPDKHDKNKNVLLFIELKRSKKSLTKTSTDQLEWIRDINKVDNVQALVCYGFEECMIILNSYMGIEPF